MDKKREREKERERYVYIYTVGSDTCQESKEMTFEVAHLVRLSFGCRFRITTAKNAQKHFGEQYSSDAFYGKPDGPIAGGDLILNTKNTVFVCSYCFFTYVYNRCINIYMCVCMYMCIYMYICFHEGSRIGGFWAWKPGRSLSVQVLGWGLRPL